MNKVVWTKHCPVLASELIEHQLPVFHQRLASLLFNTRWLVGDRNTTSQIWDLLWTPTITMLSLQKLPKLRARFFITAWHQECLQTSLGSRELRIRAMTFHFQPAPIKQPAVITPVLQVRNWCDVGNWLYVKGFQGCKWSHKAVL